MSFAVWETGQHIVEGLTTRRKSSIMYINGGMVKMIVAQLICYGREQWFVDLELNEDREKFDKFVAETSEHDKWAWEDTLHSMLCVEDVDTEWYKYYVGGEYINTELEV